MQVCNLVKIRSNKRGRKDYAQDKARSLECQRYHGHCGKAETSLKHLNYVKKQLIQKKEDTLSYF